jgi:hypothetical protein
MSWAETLKERVKTRIGICKECPHYRPEFKQCGQCGCFMPAKAAVERMHCPLKKW